MTQYRIKDMPAQIAPALVKKLLQVETATVGHFRHWGFMDRAIPPLLPMRPWPHHQKHLVVARIFGLNSLINRRRAVDIFLVPQAMH